MQRSEMRELAFKLIYETEMQKELDLNQLLQIRRDKLSNRNN